MLPAKKLGRIAVAATLLGGSVALSAQETKPEPAAPPGLQPGASAPPFAAEAVSDGQRHEVRYEKDTVLLFFLAGCPKCHRMIPVWNRAFKTKPDGLQVVGVMLDREPPGFFATMSIGFPVVRAPNRALARAFNVSKVPLMLRIAAGGSVEDTASGIVKASRVQQFFHP